MTYRIPFNRPSAGPLERQYVLEAIDQRHYSGDGPFTRRCQAILEQELGAARALLTPSGTHALEMAALLLDVGPSDEVIIPSFTFVSTANAFVLRGARPIFADVRPDTLNLDERLLPGLVSERTRAIVVMHYAGVACEMDAITRLASERGIAIVEDNAHGLFGSYRGRPLGTFGCMAAQSFHETKNVTSGEGGALIVNDAALIDRAEIVREKGTDRSRFFRGQVDKYSWVDLGSSYLLGEIPAAFLLAQLERRQSIQAARLAIWSSYQEGLQEWARANGVRLPAVPPGCEHPGHLFHVLLPSLEFRTALIDHLRLQGILAVFHYLPLHLSAVGLRFGGARGQCPVTEDVSDRLLRLPLYTDMSPAEVHDVLEAIRRFEPPAASR